MECIESFEAKSLKNSLKTGKSGRKRVGRHQKRWMEDLGVIGVRRYDCDGIDGKRILLFTKR